MDLCPSVASGPSVQFLLIFEIFRQQRPNTSHWRVEQPTVAKMSSNPQQIQTIFFAAVEKPAAERTAHLDRECGDNLELRRRVEALLLAHDAPGSFLDSPPPGVNGTIDPPISETPGDTIGPYKLVEQIGEGGFGVVYRVQQTEPVLRQVALKIIKPGMDTRQVIARFEAERQALALMDHPCIAKVFDAGSTENGRPYFAMELIKGIPITEYCDECNLPTRERLKLFLEVCRAVQHAHQKGIIHRDIKPSNVLVAMQDGQAVPKIIDFGVAKAMNQRLTEHTLVTAFAQMVGTPMYMSPEQAKMSPLEVDTRTDVYSLGVLLYELLTGATPFEKTRLKEAAFDELRRIIREEEPPRPSSRLSTMAADTASTIAERRRTEPRKLQQSVSGDLDWIAMKCLEKDRTRRYETANGLARDVERHLADEPVEACPPSAWYRLRKLARRNKSRLLIMCSLAIMLIAMSASIAVSLWSQGRQSRMVTTQIQLALAEAEKYQDQRRLHDAIAAVEHASVLVDFTVRPSVRSQVDRLLADLRAISKLEGVRLMWQPPDRPQPVDRRHYLYFSDVIEGTANRTASQQVNAAYASTFKSIDLEIDQLSVVQASERILERSVSHDLVAALDHWALVRKKLNDEPGTLHLQAIAKTVDGDVWHNRLRDIAMQTPVDKSLMREMAQTAAIENLEPTYIVHLAETLSANGMAKEAVDVLYRTREFHSDDFLINAWLGKLCFETVDVDSAIRFGSVAVAIRPSSPHAQARLGLALCRQTKWDEGIAACRKAVQLAPESPFLHASLGYALLMKSRPEKLPMEIRRSHPDLNEAEQALQTANRLDPNYVWSTNHLGYLLTTQQRWPEAEAVIRAAIQIDPEGDYPRCWLGHVLRHQQRWQEAIEELQRSIEINPAYSVPYDELATVYQQLGRWDDMMAITEQALERVPNTHLLYMIELFVDHFEQVRNIDNAEEVLQEAALLDPSGLQYAWGKIVEIIEQKEGRARAITMLEEAIRRDPEQYGPHLHLQRLLAQEDRLGELIGVYEWMLTQQSSPMLHFALAQALRVCGEKTRAIEHFQKSIDLGIPRDHDTNALVRIASLLSESENVEDRARAVEYGKRAFAIRDSGWCLQTLAHAQLRAEEWEDAAASFRLLQERHRSAMTEEDRHGWETALKESANLHDQRGKTDEKEAISNAKRDDGSNEE